MRSLDPAMNDATPGLRSLMYAAFCFDLSSPMHLGAYLKNRFIEKMLKS